MCVGAAVHIAVASRRLLRRLLRGWRTKGRLHFHCAREAKETSIATLRCQPGQAEALMTVKSTVQLETILVGRGKKSTVLGKCAPHACKSGDESQS